MINPILENHQVFGIDMDGTLINHPFSKLLQRFIYENRLNKTFHMITFRGKILSPLIETDLLESTESTKIPLNLDMFNTINTAPDELLEYYDNHLRKSEKIMSWKPMMCQKLGCTILIDDIHAISQYCPQYNVEYFHPDLLYYSKVTEWIKNHDLSKELEEK
jgi:hypothetical protein